MTQRIGTATVVTSRGVNLPGTKPGKAKRKPPTVTTDTKPSWAVELALPCRVVSEANTRGHWSVGLKRVKAQKEAFALAWMSTPLMWFRPGWAIGWFPMCVTMIHYGPEMDDDNLRRAFKAIRDKAAQVIGLDDGDPRVRWEYRQERGEPGVRVRIEPRTG